MTYSGDRIGDVEVFTVVADAGSFSAAGRRLDLAPSSIGRRLNVGVRCGPLPDGPLTARKLGETRKVIVASPDYLMHRGTPKVPEDLLGHNCLGFNFKRGSPTWPFRQDGRDYSLTIRGSVEANN